MNATTTNVQTALDLGMQLAGLSEESPIQSDTVRGVERMLAVRLPDEFARICEFYDQRGIASGYLAHVSAEPNGNTIVALAQRLRREQGLPAQYVALGAADQSVLLPCSTAPCEWGPMHEVPRKGLPAFIQGQTPPTRTEGLPS